MKTFGSPKFFWQDPFGDVLAKKSHPLGDFWSPSGNIKNLISPLQDQKSKLSQTPRVTYQNKRERGTKPMEKTRAQSDLPVWRKIQKTLQNLPIYIYIRTFGGFLGFFSELVSSIELQFFPLVQCLSRACFDRSLDRSKTSLTFDPGLGGPQVQMDPLGPSLGTLKAPGWANQTYYHVLYM